MQTRDPDHLLRIEGVLQTDADGTPTGVEQTLAEALKEADEMLCDLFGPPRELASELTLQLGLGPAATRQL